MQPITAYYLIDHAPNLTIEHIQKSASEYAEYDSEYPLKDRVVWVDYARRKIKFNYNEGKLVSHRSRDSTVDADVFESIMKKSRELVYKVNKEGMDSSMFKEVAKLFNTNTYVKKWIIGSKE